MSETRPYILAGSARRASFSDFTRSMTAVVVSYDRLRILGGRREPDEPEEQRGGADQSKAFHATNLSRRLGDVL